MSLPPSTIKLRFLSLHPGYVVDFVNWLSHAEIKLRIIHLTHMSIVGKDETT